MAKKKNKKNNYMELILWLLPCVFGIVAVCMLFAPAINYGKGENVTVFTGLQTAFGYTKTTGEVIVVSTEILKVNFLAMLGYLLPVAGIVLALLGRKSRLLTLIAVVAFVLGALFTFLMGTTFPTTVIGSDYIQFEATLAAGAVCCGIFSILGAVTSGAKLLLIK